MRLGWSDQSVMCRKSWLEQGLFSWYLLCPLSCLLWRWSSCPGTTRRSVTLARVLVDGSCDLNTVLGVPENCNSPGNDVLWVGNKTVGSERVFSLNDTERGLTAVIPGLTISRLITQQWWCKRDKTPSCWAVLVSKIVLRAFVSLCCAPCCCNCIFLPSRQVLQLEHVCVVLPLLLLVLLMFWDTRPSPNNEELFVLQLFSYYFQGIWNRKLGN